MEPRQPIRESQGPRPVAAITCDNHITSRRSLYELAVPWPRRGRCSHPTLQVGSGRLLRLGLWTSSVIESVDGPSTSSPHSGATGQLVRPMPVRCRGVKEAAVIIENDVAPRSE